MLVPCMSAEPTPTATEPRGFIDSFRHMPRWKLVMLGVSAICVVGGGILWLMSSAPPQGGTALTSGTGPGSTFVPTGGGTTQTPTPTEEPPAKGVFRLGFSFLAGFCVGAFVRSALKIAAIAVGFCAVVLFLLEYGGFVIVDWQAIDASWNRFWAQVGEEWGDFQRFATGRLPAAGLASVGLVAGFKRN